MKMYRRSCPKCHRTLFYTLKNNRNMAQKRNGVCVSCSQKGKKASEETRIKMGEASRGKTYEEIYGKETALRLIKMRREARKGIVFSKQTREKMRRAKKDYVPWNKGVPCSEDTKRKISQSEKGKIIPQALKLLWIKQRTGKKKRPVNDEGRKNIRLGRIKWIIEHKNNGQPIYPTYNNAACKIIDDYGKKHGFHFRHALNGGEYYIKGLGYWVDGYDKKRKTAIEVDEPYHYVNGFLKSKDKRRQKEIQDFLGCVFIRIKVDKMNKIQGIKEYKMKKIVFMPEQIPHPPKPSCNMRVEAKKAL